MKRFVSDFSMIVNAWTRFLLICVVVLLIGIKHHFVVRMVTYTVYANERRARSEDNLRHQSHTSVTCCASSVVNVIRLIRDAFEKFPTGNLYKQWFWCLTILIAKLWVVTLPLLRRTVAKTAHRQESAQLCIRVVYNNECKC